MTSPALAIAPAAGRVPSPITFPGSLYRLHQTFEPAGDQPEAIAALTEGIETGLA